MKRKFTFCNTLLAVVKFCQTKLKNMTNEEAEIYEQKLVQLENQVTKLEKTAEQKQAKMNNLVRKIYGILESDCGFSGEDYEGEIPERRCRQIRKLIENY